MPAPPLAVAPQATGLSDPQPPGWRGQGGAAETLFRVRRYPRHTTRLTNEYNIMMIYTKYRVDPRAGRESPSSCEKIDPRTVVNQQAGVTRTNTRHIGYLPTPIALIELPSNVLSIRVIDSKRPFLHKIGLGLGLGLVACSHKTFEPGRLFASR
jgi:hypothetical protein